MLQPLLTRAGRSILGFAVLPWGELVGLGGDQLVLRHSDDLFLPPPSLILELILLKLTLGLSILGVSARSQPIRGRH